jgi:L-ascorbate metabolism protein UlaG (beta-lactamase superfamily)
MKITKYEHACLLIEEQGKNLIIDPGDFNRSLPDIDNVVGLVITHVHFDHFNLELVQRILKNNPDCKVFSVAAVKEQLPETIVCKAGDMQSVGPFELRFYGEQHAIIHPDYPKFDNIGVMVNGRLYYAGDSLVVPDVPVDVLAIPASGPWAKAGEVMDYLVTAHPRLAFPTHDALNSEVGNSSQDRWFGMHAEKYGLSYRPIKAGESIEL